jgi:hypothetical protein
VKKLRGPENGKRNHVQETVKICLPKEALILFDYSCTPEPEGQVLLEPGKYNTKDPGLYDTTCKAGRPACINMMNY